MSEERKDEFYADPWEGKRMGESYDEARQRQMKEYEDKWSLLRAEERAQDKAKSKGQQALQDSINHSGTRDESYSRGGRTVIARTMLWLGWPSLILGLYLWQDAAASETSPPSLWGIPLYQLILAIGAICLGLVYFHQLVNFVILIFVGWLFYINGQTNEGFQFSAVPLKIWAIGVALGLVMFVILFLFERRR